MSCLKLCDSEDCYQSENDCHVYHIDLETAIFLEENVSHWMSAYDDICKDCVENTNIDYPEFFIIDEMNNLSISEKYINNPKLVQ